MKSDFNFVFNYLEKEKIAIDKDEFLFQVQSHTEYPSLLAISDTLNFFNIENLATQLHFEDIIHLPNNFIALLKKGDNQQFLTLVEKEGVGFVYQDDKKKVSLSENDFKDVFQNVVLLAEKEENNEVKTKSNFDSSLLPVLGVVLYVSFLFLSKASINVFLFSIVSMIGMYLSIEAILKEIGIQSKFSTSVCNITSNSDCDTVIKSKGVSFLQKFNYSNFSITFFTTQFLLLFIMQVSNQTNSFFDLQYTLLVFSIPVTFLSVYHQVKIAKKWCPICLFIIGLLYAEIVLIYFSKPVVLFSFNSLNIVLFLMLFTLLYFSAGALKNVFKTNNKQQEEIVVANRFKRNYKLFKLALNDSEKAAISLNANSLIVGNPNAVLKITLVTNPYCGFCKEAHQLIEKIYNSSKNDICINFQFNFDIEKSDSNSKELHAKFVEIYFTEGQVTFMEALHNWFENGVSPDIVNFTLNELKINEILNQQFTSNQDNKINFTPCLIINDVMYPKIYERNDLIYFVPELVHWAGCGI